MRHTCLAQDHLSGAVFIIVTVALYNPGPREPFKRDTQSLALGKLKEHTGFLVNRSLSAFRSTLSGSRYFIIFPVPQKMGLYNQPNCSIIDPTKRA